MSASINELLAKLENLGGDIDAAVRKGLQQACQKIQGDAKLLASVDTGRLRNSIITEVKREDDDYVGTVGTNVSYGPAVELGTGPVGADSAKQLSPGFTPTYRSDGWSYQDTDGNWHHTRGQPARPFLYPAFKQNQDRAPEIIKKAILAEIKGAGG